jgi:hypothetical protein
MNPLPIMYAQNLTAVQALVDHYKAEVQAQALSMPGAQAIEIDWTNVITRFMGSAIDLFSNFSGDPAQRKAAVLAAVTQFYNEVVKPLLAEGIGRPFIFNTFISPAIEKLLPKLIGGMYDALVKIFDRKASGGNATKPATPVVPNLPPGFDPY